MPAFALLALGYLKSGAASVLSFLEKLNPWQFALIALGLFALVQHFQLVSARHEAAKWQKQYAAEHSARLTDRQTYTRAQADAQAQNRADIQRTEQRQKEISDARVSDLNSRLERITRELRDNPSAKGSAGSAPIPETGPAPCRAFDPSWLCLSPDDRLRAAQNEERHDQLITWVIQQSQINPNK